MPFRRPLMNLPSAGGCPPVGQQRPRHARHVHRDAESGLPLVTVLAHNEADFKHAHSRETMSHNDHITAQDGSTSLPPIPQGGDLRVEPDV